MSEVSAYSYSRALRNRGIKKPCRLFWRLVLRNGAYPLPPRVPTLRNRSTPVGTQDPHRLRCRSHRSPLSAPTHPSAHPTSPVRASRPAHFFSVTRAKARDLMASAIPDPPTRPHPSSVERRSRGKWLQTAPQEPKSSSLFNFE